MKSERKKERADMATLIAGRAMLFTGVSIEDYLPNEKIVVSAASSGRKFH